MIENNTRPWTAEDDRWLHCAVGPAALKRTRSTIRNGLDSLRALRLIIVRATTMPVHGERDQFGTPPRGNLPTSEVAAAFQ